MSERMNGWLSLFRLVTPALLGVVLWVVQDMSHDLKTLKNDYYHELSGIKDRLGQIEGRLSVAAKTR